MPFSLLILQGPSASGKTVLQAQLGLSKVVTWTSRLPRAGEEAGQDYHFTDRDSFQAMYDSGKLLEMTEYQGNYYGTPLDTINQAIQGSRPMSIVLDSAGALKVKQLNPDRVLLLGVYALKEQCRRRLANRGVAEEEQERRLANYENEVQQLFQCDLIIANTDERMKQAVEFMHWFRESVNRPWD